MSYGVGCLSPFCPFFYIFIYFFFGPGEIESREQRKSGPALSRMRRRKGLAEPRPMWLDAIVEGRGRGPERVKSDEWREAPRSHLGSLERTSCR